MRLSYRAGPSLPAAYHQQRSALPSAAAVTRRPYARSRTQTLQHSEPPGLHQLDVVARAASVEQLVNVPDLAPAEQPQEHHEPFPWTKVWYPVAAIEELDPERPHRVTLLGEDYVLWRDGSGAWRCFADRCPHRLVPLSEGRVEKDGTLMCAYHAWRFDGAGKCTHVPQANDAEHHAQIQENPRSCATTYPTREHDGLVWLWPEAGAMAELESCATQPYTPPVLTDPALKGKVKTLFWRTHELPYGLDFFFENVLDPAHVVVSHHNIMGSRYTDPKPVSITVEQPLDRLRGFVAKGGKTAKTRGSQTTFQPPHTVLLDGVTLDGGHSMIELHAYPTRPGHCKLVGRQVFVAGESGKFPPGVGWFAKNLPKWLLHMTAPAFLHQDAVFLHWQEKIAAQSQYKGKTVRDTYYMPISSDKMVVLMRTWFERFSPQGIPFKGEFEGKPLPPAEREANKLFDTYNTHVKHCQVCSGALEGLKKVQLGAWVACALAAIQVAVVTASTASAKAAALVAAGAAAGSAGLSASLSLPPLAAFLWLGGALLAAGLAMGLGKFIGLFYNWPFSHADND